MEFYDSKEIIKLTGLGKSASYKLIEELNTKLKREYPGTIIIGAKVPKWYFEKKILIKEPERSNK
jgi:predicted DNA-binding transcriptional regulator AlpA